jgi:hypothetical protein
MHLVRYSHAAPLARYGAARAQTTAFTPALVDQPVGEPRSWTVPGDDSILVTVRQMLAGAAYLDATHETRTVDHDSVLVRLSG